MDLEEPNEETNADTVVDETATSPPRACFYRYPASIIFVAVCFAWMLALIIGCFTLSKVRDVRAEKKPGSEREANIMTILGVLCLVMWAIATVSVIVGRYRHWFDDYIKKIREEIAE